MSQKKTSTGKRSTTRNPPSPMSPRPSNTDNLAALQQWFLPNDSIFSKLRFHGNTSWIPRDLVWLAICWAWSASRNLTEAYTEAAECNQR